MIHLDQIKEAINSQNEKFGKKEIGVLRHALDKIPIIESFATIITGVRRSGKSTVLLQLMRTKFQSCMFMNFEDIRLSGFDSGDFNRLYSIIKSENFETIFLDEVQLVKGWEIFVNQLLREGNTVIITGSNASMLSKELGTHLTGRHLSVELFPFSFNEFLSYKNSTKNMDDLKEYLLTGGFPEYVKSRNGQILNSLINDILVRDIAVRYGVKDIGALRQLAVYLISNVATPVSANKLTGLFGIKSTTTFIEFFNYLKDAYLFDFLPQFSFSLKAQSRNPKKVYAIDTGMIEEVSSSFSMNSGRKFENMIFLHLRRSTNELYFYKNKGECDFLVFEKGKCKLAIQACIQIDDTNLKREIAGLQEAMKAFNLDSGIIVTLEQTDEFIVDGKSIKLVAAQDFMSGS